SWAVVPGLLLLSLPSASIGGVHFTSVYSATDAQAFPAADVALNNLGEVVFRYRDTALQQNVIEVYGPDGRRVVATSNPSGGADYFDSAFVSINNLGHVGFQASTYAPHTWNALVDDHGTRRVVLQIPVSGDDRLGSA